MQIDPRIEWLRPFMEAACSKSQALKAAIRSVRVEELKHGKDATFEAQMSYEIATGLIDIQIRTHFWSTYVITGKPNTRGVKVAKKRVHVILDDLAHELAHAKMAVSKTKSTQKKAFDHPPMHFRYWGQYMALFGTVAKKLNIPNLEVRFDKLSK